MKKYISLSQLELFEYLLKNSINEHDEYFSDSKNRITNCPNCGAIINSKKCEYCGTHFT